jgi:hypothetical protein
MAEPDPYAGWSLPDRLQLLAFEVELADLPRSLIAVLWEALDTVRATEALTPYPARVPARPGLPQSTCSLP